MNKMNKLFIAIFLLGSFQHAYASDLVITGSSTKDGAKLPLSMSPISEPNSDPTSQIRSKIDTKPIITKSSLNNAEELKQLNKLKNNSKPFFNELNKEINSPTVKIEGSVYKRNQIVDINGGKLVLTPIESSIKKTDIPLPEGLKKISSDVKWVNYDDYIKEQKQLAAKQPKEKEIAKPEGFYTSKDDKTSYVDDFFDRDVKGVKGVNNSQIKTSIDQIFSEYNIDENKKNVSKNTAKKNGSNTSITNVERDLANSYKNIVDLYTNPNRKETLGYINPDKNKDIYKSMPRAIQNHKIPENLKGKPVYIRIFKSNHSLELYLLDHGKYKLANTYTICSYSGGLGPKKNTGDKKSPEGFYSFNPTSFNPNSEYYKSINLGFPNKYDQSRGYSGSLLMVHGGCKSIGCYAMTDPYIEEIYSFAEAALKNGQANVQVDIFPFKMTDENMLKYKKNENYKFWKKIKKGYDIFEQTGRPPKISVENREYVIY